MKVFLFSAQWPEYMIELANALSLKVEVVLMLPENHRLTERHKELIDSKIKFEPFRLVLHKSVRDNFKMLALIVQKIWKYKPDILHIQSNGHRLFYWIFFLKPFKTKIVNTIHDPVKHKGDQLSHVFDDSLVKFLGKYFTKKYVVHAEVLIESLMESYKVPASKIIKIPHGNFSIYKKFQTKWPDTEDNAILFFGRIWRYKGLDYFIEAANIVNQKLENVHFYIVGTGENLANYICRIKYKDRFTIVNERVSLDEAGQFFHKSAIVVLPYIEATQSGVIPVAYAYGKPVVATRVGGLPEVVLEGVTGFLVEPYSSVQIAEKILLLLENPTLQHQMGKAAYEFAHSVLDWDNIAELSYSVYCELSNK